jgi:hypothetical protein
MKKLSQIVKNLFWYSLFLYLIVLVLLSQLEIDYLFGQPVENLSSKSYQLPLDQKLPKYLFDSDDEKKWIAYINEELQNYSEEIIEAKDNLIMLRYPRDWHKIIGFMPKVVKVSKENSLFVVTFADKSLIRVFMMISTSADESLRTTIASSAKHVLTSSRISTWNKRPIMELNPTKPKFERVNFASYYYPLDYANVYYINTQNIFLIIFSEDYFTRKKNDGQKPHVRWQTVEQLVNSVTSVFIEPASDQVFNKSDDLILKMLPVVKWSQKKKGYCEFEWKVKGELKDYWVVVRSTYGTLSIVSPDKSLFCSEMDDTATGKNKNKFVSSDHIYQGKIALSNMQDKESLLTIYAISTDGKTWYRRQLKIDPKKLLPKPEYVYRRWESFDGQYTITAKFISIDGIDNIDADKINSNTLKDKIITIEKQETKEYVKVKFSNLSTNDQNYLLEQIKK